MSPDDVGELGTILGVWAHPDDEAFLSGGLMALAVRAGSRVVCVTATRGEAGSPDPERCPPDAIAAVREAELAACLRILGVDEHHWLDYEDGACATAEPSVAASRIAAVIDAVRPDTVLTFGPDGFTDHPDHRAVSGWVTAAHRRVGGTSERRLHYATQTQAWATDYRAALASRDVFPPDFPPRTPDDELSIDLMLPNVISAQKVRALRAQESQIEELVRSLGVDLFEAAFRTERFRFA